MLCLASFWGGKNNDLGKGSEKKSVFLMVFCQTPPRTPPPKDKDTHKDKYKVKDKDKSAENLNICYIFEKLRIQGYQI